jgi:hypothetical protein
MIDEWATSGAPDAQSAGHAARVLMLIRTQGMTPERYLMRRDGMSQAQAAAIIAACHSQSWVEYFRATLRMIIHGDD